MAKNEYLIAVDIGTTGCKAISMGTDGRIVAEQYYEYPLINLEPTQVEQNANLWFGLCIKAAKEVIKRSPDGNISAISACSQGISIVPVDKGFNPLDNAISWLDSRATEETDFILTKYKEADLYEITGKKINPLYSLPKVIWLKRHKPEIYEKSFKLLMPLDFFLGKLSNKFVTNHTMAAGSMYYNVNTLDWDKNILNTFEIQSTKLPSILWSGEIIGEISSQIADNLGIDKKVKVIMGAQDQKCADFGSGMGSKVTSISLGTAVAISDVAKSPIKDKKMRIPLFPFILKDQWVYEAVISTGAGSLRWFRDTLGGAEFEESKKTGQSVYEIFNQQVTKVDIGSNGVMFYPHLAGASSPYWKLEATGTFTGMTLSTSRYDLIRSIYEGIAFQIKANCDILEELSGKKETTIVYGGLAKSDVFCKLLSEVLNRSVISLGQIDAALVGTAMIAGVGCGTYSDFEEAKRRVRLHKKRFNPDKENIKKYSDIYKGYCEVQDRLLSD
ncbi:MAG: FGGY family carbohydrate kinase [Actinobacteria bacterium]|nr:FGGY family carbohydrate kinase [Actinomycetota bacterium]